MLEERGPRGRPLPAATPRGAPGPGWLPDLPTVPAPAAHRQGRAQNKGPPMPREPPPAAQASTTTRCTDHIQDTTKKVNLSPKEVPPGAGRTGPRPTFRTGTLGRVSARCAGQGAPAADEAAAAPGFARTQAARAPGSTRTTAARAAAAPTRTTAARATRTPPGPGIQGARLHPGQPLPGYFFTSTVEQVFDFGCKTDRKRGKRHELRGICWVRRQGGGPGAAAPGPGGRNESGPPERMAQAGPRGYTNPGRGM